MSLFNVFLHKVIFDNKTRVCLIGLGLGLVLQFWSYGFGLDLGLGLNILVFFPSLFSTNSHADRLTDCICTLPTIRDAGGT